MKFATRALHVGHQADAATGSVIVPMFQTSTYKQDGIDRPRGGYEYARTQNPTRGALEETFASLEGTDHGLAFGSGSAATAAMVNLLEPGEEFISTTDVYGGTYRQMKQVFAKYGVVSHFLNSSSADEILSRVNDKTRMIWVETPTNPMLNVVDIEAVAKAKPEGVMLVVDNTFATPFFQLPINLGADAVVHSTTKYMAGHSDVVGGALMTSRDDIHEACDFYRNAVGNVPGPFDCFLVHRGMKTLAVRMRQHDENARAVAGFLAEHSKVDRVFYPGLPDHPGHEVAARQMTGFSGMVSFELEGGRAERGPLPREARDLHARRITRRRRVADLLPRRHDPRLHPRGGAEQDRDHRSVAAVVGRHRTRGRSHRRPRPGDRVNTMTTPYGELLEKVQRTLVARETRDAKLRTICYVLRRHVPHYDWVGFYLVDPERENELVLGPFEGDDTDHTRIKFGEGICGQAAEREETFVVQDVSKETNYLSCSVHVNSEIVVPLMKDGRVVGEIDIDSHRLAPFTDEDRAFLERIAESVALLFD